MTVQLSEKARKWLEETGCFDEVADDFLSVANSDVVILLCSRSVKDLNRQAKDRDEQKQ